MKTIAALLLAVSVTAGAAVGDTKPLGIGDLRCEEWFMTKQERAVQNMILNWAEGYLAAHKWSTTRALMIADIDGYCKENPYASMEQVASLWLRDRKAATAKR